MKFLAFDIETAKITPEGEDVQAHRPLGIACTAYAQITRNGIVLTDTVWSAGRMSQRECQRFVGILQQAVREGFTLLTHNGLGFDFDILAEESGMHAECAALASNSIDTCFLVHCLKGYPVGLDAIAKGMNLPGKTEGMNGAMAPVLWAEGRYQEVLEYVAQDARSTLAVGLEIEKAKGLHWIAKSGRRNWLSVPRLLTVQECLLLPHPNTSWMDSPIPRSRFIEWMVREEVIEDIPF